VQYLENDKMPHLEEKFDCFDAILIVTFVLVGCYLWLEDKVKGVMNAIHKAGKTIRT
jgi:hypothetical protein